MFHLIDLITVNKPCGLFLLSMGFKWFKMIKELIMIYFMLQACLVYINACLPFSYLVVVYLYTTMPTPRKIVKFLQEFRYNTTLKQSESLLKIIQGGFVAITNHALNYNFEFTIFMRTLTTLYHAKCYHIKTWG